MGKLEIQEIREEETAIGKTFVLELAGEWEQNYEQMDYIRDVYVNQPWKFKSLKKMLPREGLPPIKRVEPGNGILTDYAVGPDNLLIQVRRGRSTVPEGFVIWERTDSTLSSIITEAVREVLQKVVDEPERRKGRVTVWPANEPTQSATVEYEYHPMGSLPTELPLKNWRAPLPKAAIAAARKVGLDSYYDMIVDVSPTNYGEFDVVFARKGAATHRSDKYTLLVEELREPYTGRNRPRGNLEWMPVTRGVYGLFGGEDYGGPWSSEFRKWIKDPQGRMK